MCNTYTTKILKIPVCGISQSDIPHYGILLYIKKSKMDHAVDFFKRYLAVFGYPTTFQMQGAETYHPYTSKHKHIKSQTVQNWYMVKWPYEYSMYNQQQFNFNCKII